jgi:glucan 1,3-beta-glucosidase
MLTFLLLFVRQWTVASTDCAQCVLAFIDFSFIKRPVCKGETDFDFSFHWHNRWLNGRGIGARYDGSYAGSTFISSCSGKSGSASSFPNNYTTFMRKNFEAQTSAYERGQGWIFWTWRVSCLLLVSPLPHTLESDRDIVYFLCGDELGTDITGVTDDVVSLLMSRQAENADDWSYTAGLDDGWIPYDPTEKIYGNLCGY